MYVEMRNIFKQYGSFRASDNVNFAIEKGKLVALLGPSGSGKTTILRMIAGLETPSFGDIYIDGKRVNDIPASKRGIGFVTGLAGLEKRYPNQLSGGQRQRVAFARALAPNPQVLLLDEPFAAIDAKVRTELRTWLRSMVTKLGITSIFVTHDQDEAVEVADEIIITNHGRIEQMGSPIDIYKSPATPFVVEFIGKASEVSDYSRLKGFDEVNGADMAFIRPEFVKISKYGKLQQYNSAAEEGYVEDILFRGNHLDVTVNIGCTRITGEWSLEKEPLAVGEKVHVLIYRIYAVDSEKTYLCENKGMKSDDVFYI